MFTYRLAGLLVLTCSAGGLAVACSSESAGGGGGAGGGQAATTTTSSTTSSTSSAGGGGAAATSTTTSASGGGAIPCSDGYTNMGKGPCDLLQQDCGAGMTCTPKPEGDGYTTECTSTSGVKGPAQSCTANTDCAAGLMCIDSQCVAVCCPDAGSDEPCNGGTCSVQVSWDGTPFFAMVCSYAEQCTLFTENACPPGKECHIQDTVQGLVTCSAPSGQQVDEGGACNYLNDCKDMQFCYTEAADAPGVCRYNCALDAPAGTAAGDGGCPDAQTCQPNFNLGIDGVSICLP